MEFLRREGRHVEARRPDVILLDLNMPRMDGRQVLGEVKRDDDLRTIPIVVLTTSNADTDIVGSYTPAGQRLRHQADRPGRLQRRGAPDRRVLRSGRGAAETFLTRGSPRRVPRAGAAPAARPALLNIFPEPPPWSSAATRIEAGTDVPASWGRHVMRFSVVGSGYDRQQVDSYLDELAVRLTRLAARAEVIVGAGRDSDQIRQETTLLLALVDAGRPTVTGRPDRRPRSWPGRAASSTPPGRRPDTCVSGCTPRRCRPAGSSRRRCANGGTGRPGWISS